MQNIVCNNIIDIWVERFLRDKSQLSVLVVNDVYETIIVEKLESLGYVNSNDYYKFSTKKSENTIYLLKNTGSDCIKVLDIDSTCDFSYIKYKGTGKNKLYDFKGTTAKEFYDYMKEYNPYPAAFKSECLVDILKIKELIEYYNVHLKIKTILTNFIGNLNTYFSVYLTTERNHPDACSQRIYKDIYCNSNSLDAFIKDLCLYNSTCSSGATVETMNLENGLYVETEKSKDEKEKFEYNIKIYNKYVQASKDGLDKISGILNLKSGMLNRLYASIYGYDDYYGDFTVPSSCVEINNSTLSVLYQLLYSNKGVLPNGVISVFIKGKGYEIIDSGIVSFEEFSNIFNNLNIDSKKSLFVRYEMGEQVIIVTIKQLKL